jgi:adenine-specific DNA-methyltransferase
MTENQQARQKLQDELRKLFQFDVSDLDFGIYRILNRKKDQIQDFIEKDLLDAVNEALKEYQQQDASQVDEIMQQIIENLSDDAFDDQGNLVKYENTKLGKDYLEALEKAEKQEVGADTEKKIYNDLFTFFSRYYDNGDFLSKRRISTRDSKYAVPYNGEEVLLHWANKDQYYIKTGEQFTSFKFDLDGSDKSVWFKVAQAETEKDNVKEEESRSFVLRPENPIEVDGNELTLWFEYRPLKDAEEEQWLNLYKKVEKPRKTVDRSVLCVAYNEFVLNEVSKEWRDLLSVIPKNKDRSVLYHKLNHYTGKNTTDYFIHKDLKSFLDRELEYYLKNEVIRVDDFIADQSQQAMEVALTRAKVVRGIAQKIIAFISQIENFQKKIFEKRKFVVDTHYCFTLDKVPEELFNTIIENEGQLQSWVDLYAMEKWEDELKWDGEWTKAFLKEHSFMMVDTQFFEDGFKFELLSMFEDLDANIGGLLFNGDNFHGLNILRNKYNRKIKSVYLDPPYNAEASEILYKNSFKHSSWLSLISTRFYVTKPLMGNDSKLCITIDDNEIHHLAYALDYYFGEENYLGTVPIRNNPQGRSTVKGFSINHEYGLFYGNNDGNNEVGRLDHSEDQIERYSETDNDGTRYLWENFRKTGTDSQRADRPKQYYPILVKTDTIRIPEMEWDGKKEEWKILEKCTDSEVEVYPIDSNGNERVWKWGSVRAKESINELKVVTKDGNVEIYRKNYLNIKGSLPNTWWHDAKYAAGSHGTNLLTNIFGKGHQFSFPKSIYAVEDSLRVCDLNNNEVTLDYFAGSGTTGHAVLNLNKEDSGQRKYILVEMGQYFDTVLKPRLQKVVFSNNWKDGVPQDQDGQSHAFKYHFIESYEDALNNIDFKNPEDTQQAMKFEDYMLHYMLDFETQGVSATLLNEEAFETPFNYQLNIQRGHDSPQPETVDMVETFHYLIGLWVQTLRRYEHQDRKYVVSKGQIRNEDATEEVCVIWRNTKDLDLDKEAKWVQETIINNQTFDRIYINGLNKVKNAEPIELTFREKMFEDVA